ncbi:MAG: hypothetical protein WDN25_07875 [Acetobacteraceae bacterium]
MTARQRFGLALLVCFVAALFGARPLAGWVAASAFAGTPVQQAADAWLDLTGRVGLDRPYDALRRTIHRLEDAH